MNIRTLAACAVVAASSVMTTQASAQAITDSFNYQGELIEDGTPANGLYDITFVLYDTPLGGVPLFTGTQTVNNVEVTDGRFQAFVNFAVNGALFDSNQTRWVEVRVSPAGQPGFTTLEPRQRIGPSPVSTYALRSGFAATSGTSLQQAYDNGNSIVAGVSGLSILTNALDVSRATLRLGVGGSNNGEGNLEIYANNGPLVHSLRTENFLTGSGEHIIYQSDGTVATYASGSFFGGGFFTVTTADGTNGVTLEGSGDNTSILMAGDTRNISLNTGASTNDISVSLPSGSINSAELSNEVGASASQNGTGSTILTPIGTTVDVIDSVTINAPASGYVLVLATLEATTDHVSGTGDTRANFGVSSTSTALPINGDIELRYESNTPTGEYDVPVTVHGFFSVNSGARTFYLLGDQNSTTGTFTAFDTQLTAIYIPTLYGSLTLESNLDIPDEFAPIKAPMTDYEILLKRNATLEANDARMQQELDEIRAQMQVLKERTDREFNQRIQD